MNCPSCGKLIDCNTGLFGAKSPKPGSVSICIYCAGIHLFTKTGLREPSANELLKLLADAGVRQAQLAVKEHIQTREAKGGATTVRELDKNEVSRVSHGLVNFFKEQRVSRHYACAAMELLVDIMRKETGERTIILNADTSNQTMN